MQTSRGFLAGTETESGVLAFLGIPYAEPPTGLRRFKPPTPAAPWTGTRSAGRFSAMAIQPITAMEHALGVAAHPMSEDCLYLNVWTPATDACLPVMVWLHGGAFTNGAGSVPWYDGQTLAREHEVVVVTLNYRLGVFGFLDLSAVDPDGFAGSANAGLLDQKAALEWVADNIGGFGGDPANVCAFGQSAGAISITALIGSPGAAGLFRRAILQSGLVGGVVDGEASASRSEAILGELGLDKPAAETLAGIPAPSLLEAQNALASSHPLAMPFSPSIDGVVLPRQPIQAIEDGVSCDLDILVGANADETRLFRLLLPTLLQVEDRPQLIAKAALLFGAPLAEEMVSMSAESMPDASLSEQWETMLDSGQFHSNVSRIARAHSGSGGRCHTYLFAWRSTALGSMLGSCLGLEIPLVFRNLDKAGAEMMTGTAPERQDMALMLATAWTTFARSGTPSLPLSHDGTEIHWPCHTPTDPSTMILDAHPRVADLPSPPWDQR